MDFMGRANFAPPPLGRIGLSLTNVIMLTTDGIYVQKEGLAMGSPASPLLANLWLHQFESVFEARDLKLFRRYVDDILCVIK